MSNSSFGDSPAPDYGLVKTSTEAFTREIASTGGVKALSTDELIASKHSQNINGIILYA